MHSTSPRPSKLRAPALALTACAAAGLLTAAVAPTPAAAAPADDDLASRFTLAVLPDTQFYSRYSDEQFVPRYGTDPFSTQTEWLAENADALNIPFVTHLGDVVDQSNVEGQWRAADRAMSNLEDADMPYSIIAGNHDVRDSSDDYFDDEYDLSSEPFLTWFGTDRAAESGGFGGSDPTGFNRYYTFEAEGQEFMVLTLAWRASDASLEWANQVIAEHPTLPVILTSHEVLNVGTDAETPRETDYGLRLWDELIAPNDQIFLTLNGHFHGATRLPKTNDAGHEVNEVLLDYQMAYEGGNGYLGLFEFDLTNGEINAQTASPWVVSKPQETLTSYDQPILEGAHQQYTIDIDFAERFSGFAPDFGEGATADEPSLSQDARDILLDGFEGPDPIVTEQPGDERDFVSVDGTLAHWRFNGADGVVGADTVIEDVAGDNDLHRADPADTNAEGAEWDDVTVVHDDVPTYSSDGSGVCFANSSGSRYSYLTTDEDAEINAADLSDGYTIETFLKLDPAWKSDVNGWSKAIVRTGNRSNTDMPPTRWDYTASPTALGISNLREFQYTTLPSDATKGDRTNWSGEIMTDTWAHVALVNDPEAATVTMYVDGAPVLRNAVDAAGMTADGAMPWILGADWVDDAARNGWAGCIGETRIIDHPTTAAEWLTQRADLTGLALVDAPEGELPAGTESVTLHGTGLPGADVRIDAGEDAAAAAVAAAVPAADSVVDEDGTWELTLDDLTAGDYEGGVVQALGSRAAAPVPVAFAIAADDGQGDGDDGQGEDDGDDQQGDDDGQGDDDQNESGRDGDGSSSDDGPPSSDDDASSDDVDATESASEDGDLAVTGLDPAAWAALLGAAIVLIAGGGALLVRRRARG